jgi:hypothetical protein
MPKSITAEIEIDAPVERVWNILVDLDSYPQWNPFTVRVDSTLEVGSTVDLYVRMKPNKEIVQREIVTVVEPNKKLSWGLTMGAKFLLFTDRYQVLEALGPNKTRYFTSDDFSGVLTPLVMMLYGKHIKRGFDGIAAALKERAERA